MIADPPKAAAFSGLPRPGGGLGRRGDGKSFSPAGARAASFEDFPWPPPVAVFMPDRLELVKGAPGVRRAHLDQFVAALWPARRAAKRGKGRTPCPSHA